MKLAEFNPGDIVALVWDDGEEKLVEVQSLLGGGRGKRRKEPHSVMVRLVDPETFRTYARVDRMANMFSLAAGREVLDLVRRSKHAPPSDDVERALERVGDEGDPFAR